LLWPEAQAKAHELEKEIRSLAIAGVRENEGE
jgi:hypothetical protein